MHVALTTLNIQNIVWGHKETQLLLVCHFTQTHPKMFDTKALRGDLCTKDVGMASTRKLAFGHSYTLLVILQGVVTYKCPILPFETIWSRLLT